MKHMFRIRTEHISERVFKLLYTTHGHLSFPPSFNMERNGTTIAYLS